MKKIVISLVAFLSVACSEDVSRDAVGACFSYDDELVFRPCESQDDSTCVAKALSGQALVPVSAIVTCRECLAGQYDADSVDLVCAQYVGGAL